MHQNPSSAKAELTLCVERLAVKFAAAKVCRDYPEKQALGEGWGDALSAFGGKAMDAVKHYGGQALDYAKQGPGQAGLLGAGIGAGLGGLYGGVSGALGPRDENGKKRIGSSMLSGALAGAGLGGGAGLLGNYLHDQKLLPDVTQPPAAPPPTAATAPAAAASAASPATPLTFGGELKSLGNEAFGDYVNKHPVLSTIGALDAGNQAVGTLGELTARGSSINPQHLQSGLARATAEGGRYAAGIAPELSADMATLKGLSVDNPQFRELMHQAQVNRHLPNGVVPGFKKLTWGNIHDLSREGSGAIRGGNLQDVSNMWKRLTNRPTATDKMFGRPASPPTWTGSGTGYVPDPHGGLMPEGAMGPAPIKPPPPGWTNPVDKALHSGAQHGMNAAKATVPTIKRTLAEQPFSARNMPSKWNWKNIARRLGPRGLLYAGLPLLESYGAQSTKPVFAQ